MREDTQNRLLPGDGSFDLPRVVAALDRIGALRWVGPEVISPVTEAMGPVEAARIAGDRVRELIARVRSEGGPPEDETP
jgi:sugar phosphate isomerase/epimerase